MTLTNDFATMLSNTTSALFAIIMVFSSCSSRETQTDVWKGYAPGLLEKAWNEKDSAVVRTWVNSLNDPSLSEIDFYNRVDILSDVTGFKFGLADPGEKGKDYWEIPLAEREAHKRNVANVYKLYSHSKIFMRPVDQEETVKIQDIYIKNKKDFSPIQLQNLNKVINEIAINKQ